MRAVPFGLWAASNREGGWFSEPRVVCHLCGSKFELRRLPDGRFECDGEHHDWVSGWLMRSERGGS